MSSISIITGATGGLGQEFVSEILKENIDDLDLLTKTRIEVLRAANNLDNNIDMSRVERESRVYYENALTNDYHTAYLVFDRDDFIGAGGISYYTVMPTFHNPTGRKAYIMNMYTKPDYRRMGIATKILIYSFKMQKNGVFHLSVLKQQIWEERPLTREEAVVLASLGYEAAVESTGE